MLKAINVEIWLKHAYRVAFSKEYLFYTNTIGFTSLCGAGDCILQYLERYYIGKTNHDYKRTFRMMVFGCTCAPVQHFWYLGLDKLIVKGTAFAIVRKKVLADQLLFAPSFLVLFFVGLGHLQGQSTSEIKKEFREKALSLYMVDCTFWPAAQVINFYFVPSHLRLTYVNSLNLFWIVYLSYLKHK